MVLNLKPATALVALLTADALSLTAAERARREQLLASAAAGDDNKHKERIASNLVLDAQFHRAMLANSAAAASSERSQKTTQAGSAGARGGGSGSARERFAEQPRIQRLLANIRRKRALTGTVQRGVNKATNGGEEGKAGFEDVKVENVPVVEEEELLELMECELPEDNLDGADVGLLSGGCDDGYACVPSEDSTLGGICASTAATTTSAARILQGYCPTGCPAKVCECIESYDLASPDCVDVRIESCRDGTYVSYCSPTDKLEQAYGQAYCDAYVCLGDFRLTDAIAGDDLCDIFYDSRCTNCYCTFYSSLCNTFAPICEQGSGAYVCYDIDYVCDLSDCCDQFGPDECVGNFGYSGMPTPAPGDLPVGGQPTDMAPSGATSDLLMSSGGRFVLLGASAVVAGLAQSLF